MIASALAASCGRPAPPSEATAAVVPNLPIINPARPVTEESLSSLEADFRRVASQAVTTYMKGKDHEGPTQVDAKVVRLFSKEKVLWMEMRLGPWWESLDRPLQEDLMAQLGRLLYSLDEQAFNQSRDVILTAKDQLGRRLGDATVTAFSTNVRLAQ
jgi:hypothetical protein